MRAIETNGLTKRYGGLVVVDNVTMSVELGERRAVIGPNGAGKTTLFNLLSGDVPQTAGKVAVFDADLGRSRSASRARAGVRRTYQASSMFDEMTVHENLVLAQLGPRGRTRRVSTRWQSDETAAAAAHAAAAAVQLDDKETAAAGDLSHGERRQLELGMALSGDPRLLLLDEPAAGLSAAERRTLMKLLDEIDRDVTILMIEHDMDVALGFADSVTVLANGAIVMTGTPDKVVASPLVQRVYLGGGAE
jgi:branched-chain amino acid transport system ATP-binding protein